MRILKINNNIVDIDEQTVIGIDLQAHDITDFMKRKVNVSNSFSISCSHKNNSIIDFNSNINITDTSIYDYIRVDYWQDNFQIIENGKCYVDSIDSRINLILSAKNSIWDDLKKTKYVTIEPNIFYFLNIPNSGNPFTGTYDQLIDAILNEDYDIYLPFYFGNMYGVKNGDFEYHKSVELGTDCQILLSHENYNNFAATGSHFMIKAVDVFRWIEYQYDINFNVETVFNGNFFKDEYASKIKVPLKTFSLTKDRTSNKFIFNSFVERGAYPYVWTNFTPHPFDKIDFKDLNLYDFVDSFFKMFNVMVVPISENEFKCYRFDDLIQYAEIVNFSGMFSGIPVFKPYVPNFGQQTYVLWKSIYEQGSKYENACLIECKNKNIEPVKDLITINGYVPNVIDSGLIGGEQILNVTTETALKSFEFFIDGNDTSETVFVTFFNENGIGQTVSKTLKVANLYNIDSEYQLIKEALEYPKYYEFKKWLSVADILNFNFFKLYWIQELNATFFVIKISGFNPDKSNEPVTLSLLKVSEVPAVPVTLNAYVDGIGNKYTDGQNNIFY